MAWEKGQGDIELFDGAKKYSRADHRCHRGDDVCLHMNSVAHLCHELLQNNDDTEQGVRKKCYPNYTSKAVLRAGAAWERICSLEAHHHLNVESWALTI